VSRPTVARWTNWPGNLSSAPRDVAHPDTVDDLVRLITAASQAGRPVKVIGAGHSFNDIAATDGLLLHLDRLSGLIDVDHETGSVTVLGGTTIAEANSARRIRTGLEAVRLRALLIKKRPEGTLCPRSCSGHDWPARTTD